MRVRSSYHEGGRGRWNGIWKTGRLSKITRTHGHFVFEVFTAADQMRDLGGDVG